MNLVLGQPGDTNNKLAQIFPADIANIAEVSAPYKDASCLSMTHKQDVVWKLCGHVILSEVKELSCYCCRCWCFRAATPTTN